jgi:hypothetical protein
MTHTRMHTTQRRQGSCRLTTELTALLLLSLLLGCGVRLAQLALLLAVLLALRLGCGGAPVIDEKQQHLGQHVWRSKGAALPATASRRLHAPLNHQTHQLPYGT